MAVFFIGVLNYLHSPSNEAMIGLEVLMVIIRWLGDKGQDATVQNRNSTHKFEQD